MAATPQNRLSIDVKDRTFRSRAPKGLIGSARVVASQGGITATVDLTNATATVNVVAGRQIKITAITLPQSTVVNDSVAVLIMEGAVQLQRSDVALSASNVPSGLIVIALVSSPTPGIHTYKLQIGRQSGTGTITNNASATIPTFILVEDIGAA